MRPARITRCLPALLLALLAFGPGGARAAPPSSATPSPSAYMLEPGDQIEIRVFGQPDLTVELRVPPQGTVSYPLIGALSLRDRSPSEVESEISSRLSKGGFLNKANVSLFVEDFTPRLVYVLGKVKSPSDYTMPVGRDLLLSQVISMAGGFTERADYSRVQVVRMEDGKPHTVTVSFSMDGTGSPGMYMTLRAGDQVLVPELESVYVSGEVGRPGEVLLKAGQSLTVSQVVALAGSASERTADLSDVQVFRRSGHGIQTISVDLLSFYDSKDAARDPVVVPNDLIYVPRR